MSIFIFESQVVALRTEPGTAADTDPDNEQDDHWQQATSARACHITSNHMEVHIMELR